MTPDKKAASLVLKYLGWVNSNIQHAKNCALIAADEIKEQLIANLDNDVSTVHAIYWNKVKQEIEKL